MLDTTLTAAPRNPASPQDRFDRFGRAFKSHGANARRSYGPALRLRIPAGRR